MDIDFNINNYNLDDILNLFQVKHDFNEKDLKKSKKKVLMLHPDKSNLKKEYFLFFSKAYKILYQMYEFKQKTRKSQSDEYSDHVDESKPLPNMNSMFKNASEFSGWFNKTFEELRVQDDNQDNGYNDWLKNSEVEENTSIKSRSHMHDEIENRKKKMKEIIPYRGVEDITLNLSSGGSVLDRTKQTYYGNSDIFSKLPYEDLKTAHTETLIPVNNDDYNKRPKYANVQEYNNQREQNIQLLSQDKSDQILAQRRRTEEENANRIAFQLLEKQEKVEKNNDIFMSRLQRISYK
uniref:J domain-containing protein n=1 Tax=viral metagenome TaxID=1070528 RepID=A0A6C0AVZ5_9ZZZZ|tara:strand:+ start:36160 stop:37038 length:879 start_codon:yes stop_codon:yes gene_type:complete